MKTNWNDRENLSDLKSLYIGPVWLITEISAKFGSSSSGKNIKYLSNSYGQTIITKYTKNPDVNVDTIYEIFSNFICSLHKKPEIRISKQLSTTKTAVNFITESTWSL